MRKIMSMVIASIMIVSMLFQTQVQAAPAISIYIDGVKLSTDQAPMMISNRAMLPLRAIFEALDAKVFWNQKAKTVTAKKDGTTVVLKLGSRTATINNTTVKLDVPAQSKNGRTMVPVRFVSEAMGDEVTWNKSTGSVFITTSAPDESVGGVSYVTAQVIGQSGDGRDLKVSFAKPSSETNVDHYRVLIVKSSNISGFNLNQASNVSPNNYTRASVGGQDSSVTLSAQSRDVDGELIRSNQSYAAFVLTVAKGSGSNDLSNPSSTVAIGSSVSVLAVNNVTVRDVSDYGDGRDLSVTFTKPTTDGNIANYRVMVVKTRDASKFNFATANNVASQNYTNVTKTSSTMTTTLSSSSRDTSGELIKSNVPYTVFVLSVSNITSVSNKLSSASTSITIGNSSITTPVITSISDVSDYGDGRDLRVNFNKILNESTINAYRIFVVKANNASSFNLASANAVSSSNYTSVNKTGNNISQILASNARDVNGASIQSGVSYKVFVLAVGTGSYSGTSTLSTASSALTLSYNNNVNVVTNISVRDVNDYNDGRDLSVSFNRVSEESNISHYRVMVVPSNYVSSFNLSAANGVNSSNYTQVNKTGYNLSQVLPSNARDIYGSLIRNGESYRVFVLSVGNGSSGNALSSASSAITLTYNSNVKAVTNLSVSDVNDYNDGRDLSVSFNRVSDESNISHYRVMVVPSGYASSFNLSAANGVNSSNYTQVNRAGRDISQVLASNATDIYGSLIRNSESYRVFVLSVGNGSSGNALSGASSPITLTNNSSVKAVTNVSATDVSDYNDGRDLSVSFNRVSDESNISHYRVMVVPSGYASSFNLSAANGVNSSNYTQVNRAGRDISQVLASNATDIYGSLIRNSESYRVFVLSVGNGSSGNALSGASSPITLTNNSSVKAVTNVSATDVSDYNDGRDLSVAFNRVSEESNISHYRIMVVQSGYAGSFNLAAANGVNSSNYTQVNRAGRDISQVLASNATDTSGALIKSGVSYKVFVLSVGNSGNNALTSSPVAIKLSLNSTVAAPTNVQAIVGNSNYGDGRDISVSFKKASDETYISEYRIMVVRATGSDAFNLALANSNDNYISVAKTGSDKIQLLSDKTRDINGDAILIGTPYKVFVLSVADGRVSTVNALSAASNPVTVPAAPIQVTVPAVTSLNPARDSSGKIYVNFSKVTDEKNVDSYVVMAVKGEIVLDVTNAKLKSANGSKVLTTVDPSTTPTPLDVDTDGKPIESSVKYTIYVLTLAQGQSNSALSAGIPVN
ncbi:copper amine oxidase N-terminal domain-containing protein [Paenibacillus sp. IHBB 10380]|uniref:copper amine oxidase N-terminal domain-containing protein n=1 Tax=Paenibacillus sp. IHBB 10380 TaxID=1566358 RepID=UPI000ACDB057|nr:copper amine oxidase N-terminal domain-containing protein [Paenibacillus sp. IHBB 10380]